jgi:zinc protease
MKTLAAAIVFLTMASNSGCGKHDDGMVLLPVSEDPTVCFRILFNVGSQNDPPGKEGLAALTATLVAKGSTQKHSYEDVLALLYPMAGDITEQVDKEMTVFIGRTHRDNLEAYYTLFKESLLEPAFTEEDFKRVKNDRLNYVRTTLRYSQDEEMGKETLYEFIFDGTPYEHIEEGYVKSLTAITLDDVSKFYRTHYTRDNLVIGLGGGFDDDFATRVREDFAVLKPGASSRVPPPVPPAIAGLDIEIIEKNVQSTAISFGFPIDVKRGDRDFYALAVATSWLGEHRNSFSHLYQVIREARGLNYGDYAYIEHFPYGYAADFPPPNVARRQQIFQVWIRPVPNETRVFALRAALRELRRLVENGMSEADFELTRKFLKGYILHYAPTTTAKLGYALDDRFYGIGEGHWVRFAKMLDELTCEDVNAALKKHLSFENIKVIFVTPDAGGLKSALVNNDPSPITYASQKPAEVFEEDKEISVYPLSVKPGNVTIVKIDDVFEG